MTARTDTITRPHAWRPGTVAPALLLLHGTGGDENDLLPLGAHLLPGAALLSPRGTVLEGSMPRFFRRLGEGVFDEADLRVRTDELADFVEQAAAQYEVPTGALVAVGFSNGANIASALLALRPEAVAGAVLIAAMTPFADGLGDVDLTGKRVLVVNGVRDPIVPRDVTNKLVDQLRGAGAEVTLIAHPGGHGVPGDALPAIGEFLRSF